MNQKRTLSFMFNMQRLSLLVCVCVGGGGGELLAVSGGGGRDSDVGVGDDAIMVFVHLLSTLLLL